MLRIITLFTLFFAITCSNENLDEDLVQTTCDSTYVGDVVLSTQAEVDDFVLLGYCNIDGNLTIGPSDINLEETDITDISELNALNSIGDKLNIWKNPGLASLIGLENLESLVSLHLHDNGLNDISAFENINSQLYSLTISEHPGLTNLSGLDNITVVTEQLNIAGNVSLNSLEGLNNLRTIGTLYLSSNASLTATTELQSAIITDGLIIQGCDFTSLEGINVRDQLDFLALNISGSITSVDAISNLTEVDFLTINEMDGLSSLEALNNLASVGELSVWQNDNLTTLNGLNSLQSANSISITDNDELINYCALENLVNSGSYEEIIIEDNTYNPTVQDIMNGNCEELPCDNGTFQGTVQLTTQQEVDDFGNMCYTKVNGSLIIGINDSNMLSNISSLTNLSSIVEISGDLIIRHMPDLTSLDGLQNLGLFYGNLEIVRCDALIDFSELSNLTSANEWEMFVAIANNASLVSLNGLSGINNIDFLAIGTNPLLTGLEGLGSISEVGNIQLALSDSIVSLEGLNFSGNTIGRLQIQDLEAITSLSGLEGLNGIESGLYISGNDSLQSLQGLEGLESVNNISIEDNDSLETLSGLNGLININQGITIGGTEGNIALSDLCALQNLFANGTYGLVTIENNAYNPTVQDIIDGNCAQ